MDEKNFICYSREDSGLALKLAEELKEKGIHVWIDQWEIRAGDNWERSIEDAIYSCANFLVVLSKAAVESDEVRNEIIMARSEKKRIFPLIFQACPIPISLRSIQYLDFTREGSEYETSLKQLVRDLKTDIVQEGSGQLGVVSDQQRGRYQGRYSSSPYAPATPIIYTQNRHHVP